MPGKNANSKLQFSLRTLLILVTIACIVLALPGGHLLLIALAVWFLLIALCMWIMLKFKSRIYRVVSGQKPE